MNKKKLNSSKTTREKARFKLGLLVALLFVTTSVFPKSVYSQTVLRLNFKNAKIETVISYIENKTDFRFLYRVSEIDSERKFNIKYYGALKRGLHLLFKDASVYPVIFKKNIILKKRLEQKQIIEISGVVKDNFGNLLEGVTVTVAGRRKGVVTNSKGEYKIKVRRGDKIFFRFLGSKTQSYIISNQKVINVVMKDEVDVLDEVMLIGYGTKEKEKISSSISKVKSKTINQNLQSGATFDRGLEGLAKGVLITQGTGELGKNPDIIIRGITSPFFGTKRNINNNNPLFVIDGVPVITDGRQFNPLQTIIPEDIEAIDILKDAAATSIYGSRGANGVIIVNTKKANYGQKTTVNLSFKTSAASPIKFLKYLNAKEFKEYVHTVSRNSIEYYNANKEDTEYGDELHRYYGEFGIINEGSQENKIFKYYPDVVKFYDGDTNWGKIVYRDAAFTSRMNASIMSGGENTAYGLSIGYVNQEGLLKAESKEQYNTRLNAKVKLLDKIELGTTVSYSNSNLKSGYKRDNFTHLGSEILRFRPDVPAYDKDGNIFNRNIGTKQAPYYITNPLGLTTLGNVKNQKNHSVMGNVFAEYDILDNLKFKVNYSFMFNKDDIRNFRDKKYKPEGYGPNEGKSDLIISDIKLFNNTVDYSLVYNKGFDKHMFEGTLVFSHYNDSKKAHQFDDRAFSREVPKDVKSVIPKEYGSGLNSYIARLFYDYDDNKLGLMTTLRLDRSSKLAPKHRDGLFPSVSAYWNINKQDFVGEDLFRTLKLRASYGHTSSLNIGDFSYLQVYNEEKHGTVPYNGRESIAFADRFANPELKWERTVEYNVGLDFGLKKNILSGSVDLYHKTTYDVLSEDAAMTETGAKRVIKNNAVIENRGFEISLGSDIIHNENFKWSINLNASKNLNKLLKLSEEIGNDIYDSNSYLVGREVNVIKGYIVNGIYQNKERIEELNKKSEKTGRFYDVNGEYKPGVGDYELKDVDGNSYVDRRDMTVIGSTQPDLFGGFRTNLAFKGINLGVNFSYAVGQESLRLNDDNKERNFLNIERHLAPKYRWSPTNRTAKLPKLVRRNIDPNNRPTDRNVFDSSYLRLTSIRLGYDLPRKAISNLGMSRVNLYVSGNNIWTLTNFPGLDPQGTLNGKKSAEDITNTDAYPSAKTFTMGLNINF